MDLYFYTIHTDENFNKSAVDVYERFDYLIMVLVNELRYRLAHINDSQTYGNNTRYLEKSDLKYVRETIEYLEKTSDLDSYKKRIKDIDNNPSPTLEELKEKGTLWVKISEYYRNTYNLIYVYNKNIIRQTCLGDNCWRGRYETDAVVNQMDFLKRKFANYELETSTQE